MQVPQADEPLEPQREQIAQPDAQQRGDADFDPEVSMVPEHGGGDGPEHRREQCQTDDEAAGGHRGKNLAEATPVRFLDTLRGQTVPYTAMARARLLLLPKNIGELELMSVGLDDQRCHRPVVESRNIHTVMPDDEGVVTEIFLRLQEGMPLNYAEKLHARTYSLLAGTGCVAGGRCGDR